MVMCPTQIYTHVAIRALKEIHTATHPARLERVSDAQKEKVTRVYRSPSQKDSPFATTGTQANFETYTINSITGQRVKIGNGHLNVTN